MAHGPVYDGDVELPELCLVLLVGPTSAGKSTFAARHFAATEIVSDEACRALVCDDPADRTADAAALEVLHLVVDKRLAAGRLTVVDADHLTRPARSGLVALARRHHVPAVAVVFDLPADVVAARHRLRGGPVLRHRALRAQTEHVRRALETLGREGFAQVEVLSDPSAAPDEAVRRVRPDGDRRELTGPFDCIGDVHGCHDELLVLLGALGWPVDAAGRVGDHPDGRLAVFVGDLVDRGPAIPAVVRTVMDLVERGRALCVLGNHDDKLVRALVGRPVQVAHGLAESLEQLAGESEDFREQAAAFLRRLPLQLVLDDGRLVVAHAGLPETMHNRTSSAVRAFALFGQTTGELDELGRPVRHPWAADYRGDALVVYGHTPADAVVFEHNTACVDTGCVFGGRLSALRYPERTVVSVPATGRPWRPTPASTTPTGSRP